MDKLSEINKMTFNQDKQKNILLIHIKVSTKFQKSINIFNKIILACQILGPLTEVRNKIPLSNNNNEVWPSNPPEQPSYNHAQYAWTKVYIQILSFETLRNL